MEITDVYQFSFFRKPILNTEPLRAVGIIDIYRYIVGHYAMLPTAALRNLTNKAEAKRYKALEDTLLEEANALKIGPMGFHGATTALKIQIKQAPTHIAGLPVAVNICCHVCRHAKKVIS